MCIPDFAKFLENELRDLKSVSNDRQSILKQYALHLIGDKFPSMNRSSQSSYKDFNVKNVIQSLKDFDRSNGSLKNQRIDLFKSLDKRLPLKLLGDDVLVEKIGKTIDGTQFYHDHVKGVKTNGFLLVDIAVKQGEQIFAVIFALKEPSVKKIKTSASNEKNKEVTRHILIKALINQLVKELKICGFSKKKITIILDRWYPSKGLFIFLRELKLNFVIGCKKSATVLLPDRKKFLLSQKSHRGRPRSSFLKKLRLDYFMENYRKGSYFYDNSKNVNVEFKQAQLNLKMVKQVMVYGFRFENQVSWKFVICNIAISNAKQVYKLIKDRWPIENIHYDIKQVFGIDKGHMRKEEHVQAHLKFVYFVYQIYLKYKLMLKKKFNFNLTCRNLHDHIIHLFKKVPDPLQDIIGG